MRPLEDIGPIIDDEPDVPPVVGWLRPACFEGDELVAQIDEGNVLAVSTQRQVAEDSPEEGQRVVSAADFDGGVVDSDPACHCV
jgi:hypothetical protein